MDNISNLTNVKLGDNNVSKIMLGDIQVWPIYYLTADPSSLALTNVASSTLITVSSNCDDISITVSDNWCTIGISSNSGNFDLTVDVEENTTGYGRIATIEIYNAGVNMIVIAVEQSS